MTEPARQHSPSDRGAMLAELAGVITEFLEPRHHAEIYETVKVTPKGTRTTVRQRHITTHPGLLIALHQAAEPAATGELGSSSFESKPSADLQAVAVLDEIRRAVTVWAGVLGIQSRSLSICMSALVSARHTDNQLETILGEAKAWRRRARYATGFDPLPMTLNDPCPYCWRKNSLMIGGDLTWARCSRCGRAWDEMTIGLLGVMLEQNQQRETLAESTS